MDPSTSGGVMVYDNPHGLCQSEQIQIMGNSSGTVNFSALTDGPYAGMLLRQKREATQRASISGNGNITISYTDDGTARIREAIIVE